MGNITFGSFIAEKRKAHKFNLRDTAKHLNIAYGYLCDIEQSRRPAPNGDFVERISAFLNLDKSEHELLLDLAQNHAIQYLLICQTISWKKILFGQPCVWQKK